MSINHNLLKNIIKDQNITPKGVIHIGVITEEDTIFYKQNNIQNILVLEANPELYQAMIYLSKLDPNLVIANCLVSTKNQQSEYEYFSNAEQKRVKTTITERTIEYLLAEIKHNPCQYNILVINNKDIDYDFLFGLKNILPMFSAIYVNKKNQSINITNYPAVMSLFKSHFLTNIIEHSNDPIADNIAIYIPDYIIQCSTIGSNGRFANQIFQHIFINTYAIKNSLKPETNTWIGQIYFNINDRPITRTLPVLKLDNNLPTDPIINQDVFGWFQYHTSYYAPYKEYIQQTYSFKEDVNKKLLSIYSNLFQDKTVIAIHIRMQDYGYDNFYQTPLNYYIKWLQSNWSSLHNPILYISTDNKDIISYFDDYKPYTDKSFGLIITQADYLIDFYVLTQANILLISNSSFSFVASMLNKNLSQSLRPDLTQNGFIAYDPWNSEVLLTTPKDFKHTKIIKHTRKLHIGGTEYHPDWEILNILNLENTDHIGDAETLYQFEDFTFEAIYASHVLEHFDYIKLQTILLEWNRVLTRSGKLYISVPDFGIISELINKKFSKDAQSQLNLMRMIFGGHVDKHDYHQFAFTRTLLTQVLTQAGFDDFEFVKQFKLFKDTSSMRYTTKDNSPLISLNVIATKIRHMNIIEDDIDTDIYTKTNQI